ncbi:pseudouridine synthase [Pleionea sediminis]|uniref:pseudouridine synthase n=1 Tax=Pleionea sediminis TaxID=2569479 RepID=UPI0011866127|nr:pseudouridine synthase [Pleionea sediminis]
MSIATKPSKITLPADSNRWKTVLDFLIDKFPHVSIEQWQQRIADGKVHWLDGSTINDNSAFTKGKVVCYYREVMNEPSIPFEHDIIYQNEHFLIADKPHFLQVTPGGQFVNECLLARLRRQLNLNDIVPVHRLDRDTAGLVMFSLNPKSRASYYELFAKQRVKKTYYAVAALTNTVNKLPLSWRVENRIEPSQQERVFQQFKVKAGKEINAKSDIELVEIFSELGLFKLTPHTGKTHQLRLHMLSIGMPILNDRYYPVLKPRESAEDYDNPLQLQANSLSFQDPVHGRHYQFASSLKLKCVSKRS